MAKKIPKKILGISKQSGAVTMKESEFRKLRGKHSDVTDVVEPEQADAIKELQAKVKTLESDMKLVKAQSAKAYALVLKGVRSSER